MNESYQNKASVLIVGGGITGLSTALFLSKQGVRPILIERHPSTAIMPQARAFNPRSMEIYRTIDLEKEIHRHLSILVDYPEMIGANTLDSEERFRVDLLAQVRPPSSLSPTDWAMIDQDELEQIVCTAAEDGGVDMRFGTELISLEQAADGVRAVVREQDSGIESSIHADYLVAADGHRAGIRNRLGIGVDQIGALAHAVYFIFDADLTTTLRGRRFLLAYLDQPTTGTALVPLRKFGRWMLGVPYHPEQGESPDDFTEQRCVELARLAVGDPDLELTLVPPVPGWNQKVSHSAGGGWVAQQFRSGRVFFVGDAAHVVPPTGSYGANTGIADAHNLAWKLAAVIKGQAGETLLKTYEEERIPVALTTLDTAMQHLQDRHQGSEEDVKKIDDLTMIFGYRYHSAAIFTETSSPVEPVEDPREPSGRPGLRAPHVWLKRGEAKLSTLDLFNIGFTLLVGPDGEEWISAAKNVSASLGIELSIHSIGEELKDPENRFLTTYGITSTGASLIRPDGFVAWRSKNLPQQPEHNLQKTLTQILALDA